MSIQQTGERSRSDDGRAVRGRSRPLTVRHLGNGGIQINVNLGKPYSPSDPSMDLTGLRVALVRSRFNTAITEALAAGAHAIFREQGLPEDRMEQFDVPGAFELAPTALRLARSKRYDAIVPLGAVIRGETDHYQYVCRSVTDGLTRLAYDAERWGVVVTFGVLTTDTLEQAAARAGGPDGNKGADAALAALDVLHLWHRMDDTTRPHAARYGFRDS